MEKTLRKQAGRSDGGDLTRMGPFRLTHKVLFLVGLASLAILTVGYLSTQNATENMIRQAIGTLETQLINEENRLKALLTADRSDVLATRQMPPAQGLIRARMGGGVDEVTGSTYEQWRKRYEIIFEALLREKRHFRQIRFIDREGQELVRVDSDGEQVWRVAQGDLQSKRHRDYFQEAIGLPDGAVYISDINLNREKGKISRPFQPTVRLATPVIMERHGAVGIIVININAEHLLSTLKTAYGTPVRMTTEEGYFLAHPNAELLWGFDLGHDATLLRENPDIWKRVVAEESGVVYHPQKEQIDAFTKIRFDPNHTDRFWALEAEVPEELIMGNALAFRKNMLMGIVLLLAGFLALSLFVARTITRPINLLHSTTRAIASGDLEKRAPVITNDEIGQLATTFNQMIDNLQRAEEELRKYHDHLEELVKERTIQLEAAYKELETFSYSVSHDLRAPLRGIDGFSKALLEDYADRVDAQGKDHLQRIRMAAQRMGQLIDDLLNLSRVTRSEMHGERVDLSALTQAIAAVLQKADPERRVTFVIQKGVVVNGDARLLKVVLENLLDNAWKFSAKHPRAKIEFGMIQHEGKPAYFVRDDGAGFDVAYAGNLFGAFQRLHAVTEFPGTGIGLVTVQRIIHRHGGRVWAEGAVEKGATLYFTI